MKKYRIIILFTIISLALAFRLYKVNWDQGYHLHPDERAIVMISERIHWPKAGEWSQVLTPESPLNPKFFAYGSFPIYLLKLLGSLGSSLDKTLSSYDKINLLGRMASAVFDIGTIVVIYLLAKSLFKNSRTIPLIAAFFYAISVLPIQLSHFFAVDTILNFFIALCLYCCIRYMEKPTISELSILGLTTGLAFATKFTSVLLVIPILITVIVSSLKKKLSLVEKLKYFSLRLLLFILIVVLSAFLFMPYAFIDLTTFITSISEQLRMARDPYVFPYTLQYINTTPYLYPLQQIFLWGLGPMIATLSIVGLLLIPKAFKDSSCRFSWLIFLVFNLIYFIILGNSAVKFMRYYLPLYPLLTIIAAYFVDTFLIRAKQLVGQHLTLTITLLLVFISFLWPLSFVNIYSQPNTRVMASKWISQNIREDSVLAIEHWDDQLPLFGAEKFNFVEMPMYDPDNSDIKWEKIESNLKKADYIILASNRIYTPLQKLTDCSKIKYEWRCYPKTDKYYKDLFSENLGFKKISEFTNYPELSFLNYQVSIDDNSADENFTVFDHPKILIFKKM